MTPRQAIEIYKKEKFYRSDVIGMTESDDFFHLYDEASCENLCVPVAIVDKNTNKCILFADIKDGDGDFGLGYFQMKVVPKEQYIQM